MRILQISSAKTFGGGERHLIDLCRGLKDRGHEVFVALRPSNEWQNKFDFLPPENIFHVSIRNAFGIFSAQKIASFVNRRGIEIVHAHVARDYIPASLVCRISKNARFVLTRHVLFPMKSFHRLALRNLAQAIAVSGAVEASLRPIFPADKIRIISNGLDTGLLAGDERRRRREEFRFLHNIPFDAAVVGTVGELKELKGQRDFVLAAGEIAKNSENAFFVVVGKDHSTNGQFRRELKRMIRVFGLEKRFLFLDWADDLPALLASFDVFVSPSHSESFGLAILEAMAQQTPIVATATGGAKELLRHGESALIAPVADPVALARAVENLLTDDEKSARLAQNARHSAEERFSLREMIDKTEALYREVLQNRK
ncbi:MAG: glycosyltransferase family 4 protein [Acidobacteria bacterium]|nr:glycosyltransferase family 4 protein [Acidobacteriota bacterium]